MAPALQEVLMNTIGYPGTLPGMGCKEQTGKQLRTAIMATLGLFCLVSGPVRADVLLEILSSPPGASIRVQGGLVDGMATPCVLDLSTRNVGWTRVELVKEGYKTREVMVPLGATTPVANQTSGAFRLDVSLEPELSSVSQNVRKWMQTSSATPQRASAPVMRGPASRPAATPAPGSARATLPRKKLVVKPVQLPAKEQRSAASKAKNLKMRGSFTRRILALISPDGNTVYTGSPDGVIRAWNAASGEMLREVGSPGRVISALALSRDGKLLLSGDYGASVKLWRAEEAGEALWTAYHQKGGVMSASFSTDGKLVATGGVDKTARVWKVEDGEALHTLGWHKDWISSVTFSGNRLISGSFDDHINLWALNGNSPLYTLTGHTDSVRAVVTGYNPESPRMRGTARGTAAPQESTLLVSAGEDNAVSFWDGQNGTLRSLVVGRGVANGALAISGSGRTLVGGAKNGRITVWEVPSTRQVREWQGQDGEVESLTISRDETRLVSTGTDGRVVVWSLQDGKRLCEFRMP